VPLCAALCNQVSHNHAAGKQAPDYQYKCCPGDHGDYDIWTTGADGAPGGEGENADVTSWDVK
jgi:hypothetical protein